MALPQRATHDSAAVPESGHGGTEGCYEVNYYSNFSPFSAFSTREAGGRKWSP